MDPGANIARAVLWRRIDGAGAEYCALTGSGGGWTLEGAVAQAIEGLPASVLYRVECDSDWRTRRVIVRLRSEEPERSLELLADGNGGWRLDGRGLPMLEGCLDVDLSATPATNSLPVRRLGLAPGEAARLSAAWVRFPSLSVEPLEQTYTRLDERLYRYESRKHGEEFAAVLEVDDLGLVVTYEGGWERVASTGAPGCNDGHKD